MQQLHLVGFTTDLDGLIFSPRKGARSGGYVVVLDDELLSSIEEAQRLRDGVGTEPAPVAEEAGSSAQPPPASRPPKPQSGLNPREIQSRLRSGKSIADVAHEAGVDEEWVLRFADPILAEQARVVDRAQRLALAKPRLGLSSQPLGTAVEWNLAEKGVRLPDDVMSAAWSAFNLFGTTWAVRFSYVARRRRHVAEWEVDLREGTLTARNRLGSELAYVESGRRRKTLPPLESGPSEPPPLPAPARGRVKRASAKKRAAPKPSVPAKKAATAAKPVRPAKTTVARRGKAATGSAASSAAGSATGSAKAGGASRTVRAAEAAATEKATAIKQPSTRARSTSKARPPKKATAKKAIAKKATAKAAADTPAAKDTGGPPEAVASAPSERPTHLARPPSPMRPATPAAVGTGRLVGAPSLRARHPRRRPAPGPAESLEAEAPQAPAADQGVQAAPPPEVPAVDVPAEDTSPEEAAPPPGPTATSPEPAEAPASPARPRPRRPARSPSTLPADVEGPAVRILRDGSDEGVAAQPDPGPVPASRARRPQGRAGGARSGGGGAVRVRTDLSGGASEPASGAGSPSGRG